MIHIRKEQYDSFIESNEIELFGSYFDGETYTFYESQEEAELNQPKIDLYNTIPDKVSIDINQLSEDQLNDLFEQFKQKLNL